MTTDAASTPRRPRTAAGSVPPQIALDVARVVACARLVSDRCEAVPLTVVLEQLLSDMSEHPTRELRTVLVRSTVRCVSDHAVTCASCTAVDSAAVMQAFDTAAPAGNLDATIAALVAAGVDGEKVTWHVIGRESVKHEGLIHKECNRLVRTLPDRTADELKGYGWAGLRVALRNFDPDLGFAFSTYACPKINGAIRDGVRAESPIPKRLTTFLRKVSKAEEQLTHQLSRTPTYAEIAAYVDSSTESMHLLPRLAPTASLEELAAGLGGEHMREPACLVDEADPERAALIAMRDEALHAAVNALPEEEAQAVRLLMLEEMPVVDACAVLGVEARQLRARKQRGLRTLEPIMRAWLDEHIAAVA